MKVVYTDKHWLEFDSRFASKRPFDSSNIGYIGFGCKVSVCVRPSCVCALCPLSFTYSKK